MTKKTKDIENDDQSHGDYHQRDDEQPRGGDQEYETIDAPRGTKHGTSGARVPGQPAQPRAETYLSAVNRGAHLNIYLSKGLMEVVSTWENGIHPSWKKLNGKPALICLKAEVEGVKGYGVRAPGDRSQRPHVCIPTGHVGIAAADFEIAAVEAAIEGDAVVITIPPGLFP